MLGLSFIDLVVVSVVLLFPLLIGLLVSKKYNILQGVITYLFFNYILSYMFNIILTTESIFSYEQNVLLLNTTNAFYELINYFILLIPMLKNEIVGVQEHMLLTIVVLSFLITQILSQIFSKNKVVKRWKIYYNNLINVDEE